MEINRRDFLKVSTLTAMGLGLPRQASLQAAKPDKKPNFIFVLVDDLGWRDLGCYGSSFYETPNLDRLAQQGMRFTNAYAACPVCSPTRAAIMTGRYPPRVNITDWIKGHKAKNPKLLCPEDNDELALEEVTLAEVFRSHGYRTFFAGKWHLGSQDFHPDDQGFELNKGGYRLGWPRGGYYSPYKNPKLEDGPEGEYLTDRLTDETLRFIESHRDEPFVAYLSFYIVHTPIQACRRYLEHFKKKAATLQPPPGPMHVKEGKAFAQQYQNNPEYASMVYAMDENVGRVMKKLDELRLSKNCVLIFTSDNGGLSTRGGKTGPTSNAPLRAGKGWCYEGGIRVPLIVRAPQVTRPGTLCDEPVISMDYFPTMLQLAGLDLQPRNHTDGISLVPALRGGSLKRESLFWHYPHYHGSWAEPTAVVRSGDWKLIKFYETGNIELYNLKKDPSERNNLSSIMPEKTRELYERLRNWQDSVGAQIPTPNPNYNIAEKE